MHNKLHIMPILLRLLLVSVLLTLGQSVYCKAITTDTTKTVRKIEKRDGNSLYRYINKVIKKNEDSPVFLAAVLQQLSKDFKDDFIQELSDHQLRKMLLLDDAKKIYTILISLPQYRKAPLAVSLSPTEIDTIYSRMDSADRSSVPIDLSKMLLEKLSIERRNSILNSFAATAVRFELVSYFEQRELDIANKIYFHQTKVPKIDPRKYITIYEKDIDTDDDNKNDNKKPIWWMEQLDNPTSINKHNRSQIVADRFLYTDNPVQKYEIVDTKATLEINFNTDSLANETDFFGNISIAAWINDRKIEVSPYSEVGKAQSKIGTNAKPTKEIAGNFIRMLSKASAANLYIKNYLKLLMAEYDNEQSLKSNLEATISSVKTIMGQLDMIKSRQNTSYFESSLYSSLVKLWSTLPNKYEKRADRIRNFTHGSQDIFDKSKSIKKELDSLVSDMNKSISKIGDEQLIPATEFNYIKNEFLIINDYLNWFNNSGSQTKEAFLEAIGMDKIMFNDLTERFKRHLLGFVRLDTLVGKDFTIETLKLTIEQYSDMQYSLEELSDFRGSKFHSILSQANYEPTFLKTDKLATLKNADFYRKYYTCCDDLSVEAPGITCFYDWLIPERWPSDSSYYDPTKGAKTDSFSVYPKDAPSIRLAEKDTASAWQYFYWYHMRSFTKELDAELYTNENDLQQVQTALAQEVGRIIYKRLIQATIDLDKADAKPGDMLRISLMWYDTDGGVTDSMPVELVTAKFRLENVGWNMHVADAELFTYRINEDKLGSNYPLSPSKFKPTAGVSLLWSYTNDKRVQPRDGYKVDHGKKLLRFFKWIEPSFGINVTFLDFRTDETFEFGMGPTIGFFNKQLFITSGYNFRADKIRPFYFGIGVSFANIFLNTSGEIKRLNNQ